MRKILLASALLACTSVPTFADDWTLGVGTGPFGFGYFAERSTTITTETGSVTTRSRLSAATRAGASVDVEYDFADRFGVRLDSTWTRAPLRVKSSGGSGVTFDAGQTSITMFALPLIIRLNRNGALRFHLAAGPAYGFYEMERRAGGGATLPVFEGTRGRWGAVGGAGVAWWLGPRFAVEGEVDDIVTSSPFRRSDFGTTFGGMTIPKTHNVHTTIGIRYRL